MIRLSNKISYNLLAFVLILFVTTSCSQQKQAATTNQKTSTEKRGGPPSVDEVFKMDTNQDGKLAKSEVKGPLAKDFSRFDSNNDGFITREEFENAPRPQRGGGGRPNK